MANIVSAEVPFSVLEAQTDLFQQSGHRTDEKAEVEVGRFYWTVFVVVQHKRHS